MKSLIGLLQLFELAYDDLFHSCVPAEMLTLVLGVHSLLLPHLPARGDHALRNTHLISDSSHWVVPGILLQGDGSPQAQGEAFQVGCLNDIHSLGIAVATIEKRVRAGETVYVHGGSVSDEGQAALACACTLGLLYDMTAEEAFARVKGYGCELREPAVDHSTLSDHEGAMGGFRWLLVEAEVHRIKTARAQEGAAAAEEGAVVPLVMQGGATLS